MTNKPIRILQINAGSKNFGGVSSFLYNVYSNIDRSKIQFDFLSPYQTTYGIVKDQITSMGGNIFELGVNGNFIRRTYLLYHRVYSFFKEHRYKIVHINSGSIFFNYVISTAARKANIENIIVHSHNGADSSGNFIRRLIFEKLKLKTEKNANHLYACSNLAARFMFSDSAVGNKKVTVIHNGIDIARFCANKEKRKELRDQYNLTDKYVIGNIGRLVPQKNQSFLLKVFEQLHQINPQAVLLIYGEGELKKDLETEINDLGIKNCVYLMNPIIEIENAYNMMDAFVLTSIYEGLPVTGIEAQANGLNCFFSDSITNEVKINNNVFFLSLNDSPSIWAAAINDELLNQEEFTMNWQELQKYDIANVAADLCKKYEEMISL